MGSIIVAWKLKRYRRIKLYQWADINVDIVIKA